MPQLSLKEWLKVNTFNKVDFKRRIKKDVPILIYQMGKVGSSSIYHPLKERYPGVVGHTHQFNQEAWYWEVRKLHEMYYSGNLKKLHIISLIREPIGRNVSEFFHRIKQYAGIESDKDQTSVDELVDKFLNNMDHRFSLDWFDNNFKKHFGIDVYEYSFPNENFTYYEKNGIKVLLMKHDLEDELKGKLISDFLNLTNFKLERRNVGSEKGYKKMYGSFKAEAKLPKTYLDVIKNSKYFNHFYSDEYINETISKWM